MFAEINTNSITPDRMQRWTNRQTQKLGLFGTARGQHVLIEINDQQDVVSGSSKVRFEIKDDIGMFAYILLDHCLI